jgi:hypothetical protein
MKKVIRQSAKAMLLLFVTLVFVQANAQKRYAPLVKPDVQYTIENEVLVSPLELQFDLYLKETDPAKTFELAIIQGGILVNKSIIGTGTVTTGIVTGFSDLVSLQQPTIVLVAEYNSGQFILKITPRTGPGAGKGTIISTSGLGSRVARIRITNSVPFVSGTQAGLKFCFTKSPYPSKVFEYIKGVSMAITCSESNCFTGSTYEDLPLNTLSVPSNVTNIGIYSNEKTIYITNTAGFRNAHLTVSSVTGQEILTRKLSDQPINEVEVNALKGYYIVRVQEGSSVKTARVYIN